MNWSNIHPIGVGVVTFLLMSCDWLLTILQEREKRAHHDEHYQSYPVETIEGNPLLQVEVRKARFLNLRHQLTALLVSVFVAAGFYLMPLPMLQEIYLGFVWGIFLIVCMTHLGNLIIYRISRRGLHGKLYIHQRTSYQIQAGRYIALTVLLAVLAVASRSPIVIGVSISGLHSVIRMYIWLRKVPAIDEDDLPPTGQEDTLLTE